MKSKIILFVGLFFSINVWSQELPKVIHPSPETASLFRFLDIPVNYSTGIPEISVPIYEVKCGSLSVPITLSYHAAGRRPEDETGPVGLGWSLNAGGMISRTIHGRPDEECTIPTNLISSWSLTNKNNYGYLAPLYYGPNSQFPESFAGTNYGGPVESEFDVYSYYFGSNSGKFVLSPDRDSVYLMPLKPIKVLFEPVRFPSTILDDKGNSYYFGAYEYWYQQDHSVITGANLTSIISANKKDTITFSYVEFPRSKSIPSESYNLADDITVPNYNYSSSGNFGTIIYDQQNYYCKRLKEIKFRNGKVKFNLVTGTERVSDIEIYNNRNEVVKKYQLQMSPLDLGNFKLDEIKQIGLNGQSSEKYTFEYQPSSGVVDFGKDFWGYANGVNQFNGVPFYYGITFLDGSGWGVRTVGSGAQRNATEGATMGTIKKITYPTGGSTEFSFESNLATSGFSQQSPLACGGLRVKQIKTIDNNGNTSYKTYSYGINECGYGEKQLLDIQAADMSYETRYLPNLGLLYGACILEDVVRSYRMRRYTSNFLPDIEEMANEPVFYPEVTEYNGTPVLNTGKTIYRYYRGQNFITSTYSDVNFSGWVPDDPYIVLASNMTYVTDPSLRRKHIAQYNYYMTPFLGSKTVYKNTGGNVFVPVSSSSSWHNYIQTNTLRGMHIIKYLEIAEQQFYPLRNETFAAQTLNLPVFMYGDYQINIGKDELASTSETLYNDNGNVTSTTNYIYNNNLLVSEIHTTTSSSGEVITTNTYPFDYPSNPNYQAMTNDNMINYVVEQAKYKNSTSNFLNSTVTNYGKWHNDFFAPTTIDTRTNTPGNYPIPRIRFFDYDKQVNVKSVSKEFGPKVNYIYSYKGEYPIAKIENAEYSTVETVLGGPTAVENFMKMAYPTDAEINTFLAPLRSNLTNAMVTTFTYRPLVGITSSTDPKGLTTYYEYDNFQRLKSIKDLNGNIIKSFDYHYKQ